MHVLYHIKQGDLLDVREHANKEKYPHQKILIVKMDDYAYVVPFVEERFVPSRGTKQVVLQALIILNCAINFNQIYARN